MPIYDSDEQLYNCFQALFNRIGEEDAEAKKALLKSKLSIRFSCTEPTAAIVIDAQKEPVEIVYGPSNIKPKLDIALSADTLHEILLGEIGLSKAMGSGRMKPKGPIWKSVALEPLLHDAQKFYPEILKDCKP